MHPLVPLVILISVSTPDPEQKSDCENRSRLLYARCMELSEGVPAAQLKCKNEHEVREEHCEKKAKLERNPEKTPDEHGPL